MKEASYEKPQPDEKKYVEKKQLPNKNEEVSTHPEGSVAYFTKGITRYDIIPKEGESIPDAITRVTTDHSFNPARIVSIKPKE